MHVSPPQPCCCAMSCHHGTPCPDGTARQCDTCGCERHMRMFSAQNVPFVPKTSALIDAAASMSTNSIHLSQQHDKQTVCLKPKLIASCRPFFLARHAWKSMLQYTFAARWGCLQKNKHEMFVTAECLHVRQWISHCDLAHLLCAMISCHAVLLLPWPCQPSFCF